MGVLRRLDAQREGSAMYETFRLTIADFAIVFVTFPANAPAQVPATQLQLTDKNVES
jgi:hypothetical protein